MTCTKRLRILFFTLSLSLLFPKQKRAWGVWCLIPLRVLERGDQPGWSPGWWASPCPGAESRALNHRGAQGAASQPCTSAVQESRELASVAPNLPFVGEICLLMGCEWGGVLYVVFFLSSQDHFFPLRLKTKGKNSWGDEVKFGEHWLWFSALTWFPSLP